MERQHDDPPPEPVTPPPIDAAPSATGVVDGDPDEVEEARPPQETGEREDR